MFMMQWHSCKTPFLIFSDAAGNSGSNAAHNADSNAGFCSTQVKCMMSMLTHIVVRRYAHHHALLIVFLASAIWGVLWVLMRYAESFGISGLWVVNLFHVLPAMAILPFVARAYIAGR